MEGSHSPFGLIWQIAAETGWSTKTIMWEIPYPTLLLMMQDAPRWVDGDRKKKSVPSRKPGQSNVVSMFEQHLNK